jgi:seryl-tRNA synthetase
MLDIKLIKEDPARVKNLLLAKEKDCSADIDRVLELDTLRRDLIYKTETAKPEQNRVSKEIPLMKKEGKDTAPVFAKMKELSDSIKSADAELKTIEDEYRKLMLSFPNLPDPDLKPGGKENNAPVRYFGEPHKFDFEPKNHVDLCTSLGLNDYPRGVKLSGSGFWIYRGMGARLEWALLNYFIDTHLADGYELVLVPHMLGYEAGLTADRKSVV